MGLTKMTPSALAVIVLLTFVEVNSLKCYVCNNCAEVTDNQLKTCASDTVITTTTTTTASSGTDTTASTTWSTPDTPSTADSTTSDTTTTDSSTTTTDPTTTTTDPTTTTTNPTTTTTDATTTTTEASTTTTDASTTTTEASTTTTEASTTTTVASIEFNYESDPECSCYEGECNCGGKMFFVSSVDNRADTTNATYVCLKSTLKTGNTTIITRGCGISRNTTAESCQNAGFEANCKVCNTDGCNTAYAIRFSFLLLLIPAVRALIST